MLFCQDKALIWFSVVCFVPNPQVRMCANTSSRGLLWVRAGLALCQKTSPSEGCFPLHFVRKVLETHILASFSFFICKIALLLWFVHFTLAVDQMWFYEIGE